MDKLTPHELKCLRKLLARAEEAQPARPNTHGIRPGDVVQLHPLYDRAFGGMLAVVMHVTPYELRGFLLRPHRGGCSQAWLRINPTAVEHIGHARWPANGTDFSARCCTDTPFCKYQKLR